MYLSNLLINVGDNPDRPDWNISRRWLRNLYRVHQRLCMAFPSKSKKDDDPDFLMPYNSDDFGTGQVGVPRMEKAGFLYRIDAQPGGGVMILVLSAIEPKWGYAFHNARHFLKCDPQIKPFDSRFAAKDRLRFLLLANPTKKVGTLPKERRQSLSKEEWKNQEKRHGRRVPVPAEELAGWLTNRAEYGGFSLVQLSDVQAGYLYFNKPDHDGDDDGKPKKKKQKEAARLRSARYEGILEVVDPGIFRETIARGIGPGKAFGFGLLSVGRASAE